MARQHSNAAYAPDDVEDAKRGRPRVSTQPWAHDRGLEYMGSSLPGAFSPVMPIWQDYVFNLARGSLSPTRFGYVANELDEIGLDDSRTVFLLYGCTVLAVRIFGARIPDRFGPLTSGSLALSAAAAGLVVVAAVHSPAGLYAGTFVFSLGMSLLYPAMLTLALTGVPERERGSAVGTISSFFDLSQGLGAAILGAAVAVAGYRGAFVGAAAMSVVGLVLLRSGIDRRTTAPVDHGAASAAREHVEPEPT